MSITDKLHSTGFICSCWLVEGTSIGMIDQGENWQSHTKYALTKVTVQSV